ncbi:RNA polymerase sigma factor [Streptomyces sp. URMC 123]|uniref:RNA polymerase sigma factor n=1 Tax=Streptomyces sp. URMC 123 TaxID=3423403 RepID=UPI003F1B596E
MERSPSAIPEPGPGPYEDFSAFYRREYPKVVSRVLAVGATYHEAEDAAQDAMRELLARRPECHSPAGWVRTAAVRAFQKRAVRDRMRREREEAHMTMVKRVSLPVRSDPDEHRRVMDVVRALPPRQGQVLALSLDGYRTEEIAELLGIKPGTVRSNLRHALDTLRRRLAEPPAPGTES